MKDDPPPSVDAAWRVRALGPRRIASPLGLSTVRGDEIPDYVADGTRVLNQLELAPGEKLDETRSFEKAGPRRRIFFEPGVSAAGILTAGGLCPGINNVIRSLVLELFHKYGVHEIVGFRYGYAGLDPAVAAPAIALGPAEVGQIHMLGGTILGTSRGAHRTEVMTDTLARRGVQMLFAIGGDGTMRGAHAIATQALERGLDLAVVGVPKTIDNDIPFVDKSFGFETAVSVARSAIDAAHTEATSSPNGVGIVRLMGREAGFIAAMATVASHDVNVCLVPEVGFRLDGEGGLLAYLERRLAARGHAVIVVAEGCGKVLGDEGSMPLDASGNVSFASATVDIGMFVRTRIAAHFAERRIPLALKYIDPSYMIRGVLPNAIDAVYCDELARYAVHAAMAGKTDLMIGRWHRSFTHVPLPLALSAKKRIDPDGELWLAVTEVTGQPRFV